MQSLTELADQQLIQLYMNGNKEAISVLILRHKEKIFTSIYLMVKDKYLAEDMFQDTFIRIIDKLDNGIYTENGKFLPWAMRMAHNLCIDHFRKVKRKPVIKSNYSEDIFDSMNFSEAPVEDRIMQDQSHQNVRKLLDLLPSEQREVLIMRNYADLSFKEIAELMNCSINTALGRMRYGLMNMRKLMNEEEISCRMV